MEGKMNRIEDMITDILEHAVQSGNTTLSTQATKRLFHLTEGNGHVWDRIAYLNASTEAWKLSYVGIEEGDREFVRLCYALENHANSKFNEID